PPRAPPWDILVRRYIGGTLEAFWRHFKSPGNDESGGKTEDRKQHHKPNDPIGNFEEWKNLGGDLDQEPGDNSVSDCDPVDVASLQFGKKVARIHSWPSRVTFSFSLMNEGRGKVLVNSFIHGLSISPGINPRTEFYSGRRVRRHPEQQPLVARLAPN